MVVVETIVFAYVPNTQTPPAIYNIHGAPAINNTHLFYGGVPNFLATIPLNTTIYYNTVTVVMHQTTVVAKKRKTTLLVKLLTKSFYVFWPPLYV